MARPTVIKIGSVFGRLRVIGIEPKGAGKHAVAVCTCECGATSRVSSGLLKKMKSCGCSQHDPTYRKERTTESYNRKPYGEAMRRSLYLSYKRSADRRELLFNLSEEEFSRITQMGCHYCGSEPKPRMTYKRDGKPMYNGPAIFNGVDRIDSNIGYSIANCVPCCSVCNYAKRDMPYQDFIAHCLLVAERQNIWTKP